MAETARIRSADPDLVDHRVYLYDVSWEDYERFLAVRGDNHRPRMTYLDGVLEIMTTSSHHERLKTRWARLLEAWSEEMGIDLEGIGSWTIRNELKKKGVEPDECYFVGDNRPEAEMPDLALEVVWTSGGLDKLLVYAGLGVREVWMWMDDEITMHALRGSRYEQIARSELLPALDPVLITDLVNSDSSQAEAVRTLRASLRASRAP